MQHARRIAENMQRIEPAPDAARQSSMFSNFRRSGMITWWCQFCVQHACIEPKGHAGALVVDSSRVLEMRVSQQRVHAWRRRSRQSLHIASLYTTVSPDLR
jgi:hypothetical protein